MTWPRFVLLVAFALGHTIGESSAPNVIKFVVGIAVGAAVMKYAATPRAKED